MQRSALTSDRIAAATLAVVMAITAGVLLHAARGTTFYFDDWNFVLQRLDWRPHTLLFPHNEHLSLVPVLIYKVVLSTLGLAHYEVLRVVNVALNLLCGLLLFLYARPRIGSWPAVALASALMLMGQAFWDIIWAFQIGYLGSLAAGLGALLALDRGTRRGDVVACILVATAIASSGLGLPILLGVAAELAVARQLRVRGWIAAIPAVLYAVWYVKYGVGDSDLGRLPDAAENFWEGFAAAASAITGLPAGFGPALALALLAGVVFQLSRPGPPPARLVGALLVPVSFWAAVAVARGGLVPAEPRYLYPAGLWLAVVVAEVARPFLPRGRALVLVVGLLAIGVVANASHIAKGGAKMRGLAGITKSYLTAAEVYGPELTGPSMRPDPGQPQIYAGRYFDAVERYGSSVGYSAAELRGGSPALRKAVDEALLHVIPPTPEQAQAKPAAARDCRRAPAGGELFYDVPPKGVYLRAGDAQIELNMRRFGDTLLSIPPIAPGTEALVTRRPDRSSQRWELQARSAAPFEACLAG